MPPPRVARTDGTAGGRRRRGRQTVPYQEGTSVYLKAARRTLVPVAVLGLGLTSAPAVAQQQPHSAASTNTAVKVTTRSSHWSCCGGGTSRRWVR
ncbi:hypothetical protein [Streptomyces camponoticapitis]|uniref:hypothetical protein n=1 Tax=Streptomyces camponoticapitis TaxID=1616125 RepID=UPI00166C5EE3|nr:hypothetical protein [Streptomyces camponoticapitis]